jgi:TonB family protein
MLRIWLLRAAVSGVFSLLACVFVPGHVLAQQSDTRPLGSTIPLASPREAQLHVAKRVEPAYPPLARMTGTRGPVTLRLTVGTDGKVKDVHILSGHPLLQQAALDAVRQWEYEAFLEDNRPIETAVDVTLDFPPGRAIHPPVAFPEVKDMKSVVITLSRGWYSLLISGNGTVEYQGLGSVCVVGKHHGHISEQDFETLLQDFRTANYFSLDDEYGGTATDSVTTVSSITIDNQKKQIEYMYGAPQELADLEDAIDSKSHSQKWVNCNSETVAALQAEGIDLRSSDKTVEQFLIGAVSYGDASAVRDFIRAGTAIHVTEFNGRTPLMIAAMRGLPNIVELLLNAHDNPQAADKNGRTVLMYGASSGIAEVVLRLLRAGAKVNGRSKEGNTALMAAAAAGNPEVVAMLLHGGAAVNTPGWKKTTALLAGASGELEFENLVMGDLHAQVPDEIIDRAKVVHLLLDAGADISATNEEGENSLFTIYDEAVRELVKTRINLNARNRNGETPLIATVAADVARVLISAGADPNLTDPAGRTALMHSAQNNYVENLKVLVQGGAKLDLRDEDGSTALMLCAEKDLPDSVKVLVGAHANVNLRDNENLTALGRFHRAHGKGRTDETEKLLLGSGGIE